MEKNTKLYKFLRVLYANRDKELSGKVLSEQTGIEEKQIVPFYKASSQHIERKKINGLWHYKLKTYREKYVRDWLMGAT